jgi:hypothetical protein
LFSVSINADVYRVDVKNLNQNIMSGHLKMGNPGPDGKEISVNNKYLSIGGKPFIPVMGEMHFSRCDREQWEDRILKMKANGINIIATYVFWIHHEETEGIFDWTGNNDFRAFVKLCHQHNLFVYPRLGPWCHGEVRNGGTPDWIFTKKGIVDRSNNEKYQFYADRLYSEIAKQMSGLYYKDGGPIIGVQLENEYRRGPGGNAHILWLKQTAKKYGIDVPLYTVTGWGNASVPQDEVIPLFGGYPEEPWVTNLIPAKENINFCFDAPLNDEGIGADVAAKEKGKFTDYSRYPYLTCEIGLGNQISYHRRPILNEEDGAAMTYAKIGSGSNLPGYYVFTGGFNPIGKYTSLEENQDETGYWNQYCDISYDFQAPIRETGELAGSYHQIKKLHYFLNEFGDRLAPMVPVIPINQKSTEDLQWAIRSDGESGFVFGLNYYRNYKKPLQKDVQFEISLENEKILFPAKPVEIADSSMFIWPFNIKMGSINLKYATAQPLCTFNENNIEKWFFIKTKNVQPEFCIDAKDIIQVKSNGKPLKSVGNSFFITGFNAGSNNKIDIRTSKGKSLRLIVLDETEADKVWFFNENGSKYLFISEACLYLNNKALNILTNKPETKITSLSDVTPLSINKDNQKVVRKGNTFLVSAADNKLAVPEIQKESVFENTSWFKTSVGGVSKNKELYHNLFSRKFDLKSLSEIKSARLYIYTDGECRLRLNNKWLNQDINSRSLNVIDVTGYLSNGKNIILADFPFSNGDDAFAARIVIDYFNTVRTVVKTDSLWRNAQSYTLPVNGKNVEKGTMPLLVNPKKVDYETNSWNIMVDGKNLNRLNNAYLHIDYVADEAQCRNGEAMVSDNYYNGTPWSIQLAKAGSVPEINKFNIELKPLKTGYKVLFDVPINDADLNKAILKKVSLVPEYKFEIKLR